MLLKLCLCCIIVATLTIGVDATSPSNPVNARLDRGSLTSELVDGKVKIILNIKLHRIPVAKEVPVDTLVKIIIKRSKGAATKHVRRFIVQVVTHMTLVVEFSLSGDTKYLVKVLCDDRFTPDDCAYLTLDDEGKASFRH